MLFTRRSHNRSVFAAVCVAWGREHSKELGQIKKAVTLKKVMAKMCGIEKWFVLHFSTNHFVHKKLTKYFSKKLKFFRVAHSKLGAKALSFSSSPHRKGKRWEDIFFSCSQKWTRKNPETVAASGFSGAISFLVAQCGCGRRTRTSDLRVMSCGLDGLSAPLRAFAPFLSGTKIRFEPLCSVGSVQSEPRMGHGLGQTLVVLIE